MLLSTGERISCALCAMAINDLGHGAISLTGSQAGIVTDASTPSARIVDVRAERIVAALDEDRIVLVAGFQGVSTGHRRDDARTRRLGHDRCRARGGARRRGLRDLHRRPGRVHRRPADRPGRAQAAGRVASRRCSRWLPRARACCSCARSSTRATTVCASTAAHRSRTGPVRLYSRGRDRGAAPRSPPSPTRPPKRRSRLWASPTSPAPPRASSGPWPMPASTST